VEAAFFDLDKTVGKIFEKSFAPRPKG